MTKTGRIETGDWPWRLYAAINVAFVAALVACLVKGRGTPAPYIAAAALGAALWITWRRFESHLRLVSSIRGVTTQGANVAIGDGLLAKVVPSPSELVAKTEAVIAESARYWLGQYPSIQPSWHGIVVEYVDAEFLRYGNPTFGGGKAHGLVVGKFVGIAWAPDDDLAHVEAKLRHEADHIHLMAAGVPTESHHAMMERHGRG